MSGRKSAAGLCAVSLCVNPECGQSEARPAVPRQAALTGAKSRFSFYLAFIVKYKAQSKNGAEPR